LGFSERSGTARPQAASGARWRTRSKCTSLCRRGSSRTPCVKPRKSFGCRPLPTLPHPTPPHATPPHTAALLVPFLTTALHPTSKPLTIGLILGSISRPPVIRLCWVLGDRDPPPIHGGPGPPPSMGDRDPPHPWGTGPPPIHGGPGPPPHPWGTGTPPIHGGPGPPPSMGDRDQTSIPYALCHDW
jgi:hypothetical protein